MKKILIVEDEININELIKYNLQLKGYEIIQAFDGITGITMTYRQKPDLIILDIMIPGKDGYQVCEELRRSQINTPIIMLTAKSEEEDKVKGLDIGADDYISKPFSIKELISRVNANLRRSSELNLDMAKSINDDNLDVTVDRNNFMVKIKGTPIDLTFKEYEIMTLLMDNSNKVYSRNELLDIVWGVDYMGEIRTVDVHIRHLRKKICDAGGEEDYIETVRGRGYKWKQR